MSNPNIELMKLQAVAFQKLADFLEFGKEQAKDKLSCSEPFDYVAFLEELQNCSPAGIDYNIAIQKLNKYKEENCIY